MLTILTTTNHNQQVVDIVATINRLDELVKITADINNFDTNAKLLIVEDGEIKTGLDWHDTKPPYIFPTTEFSADNLLALVFYKLGNHQKAFEIVSNKNDLYHHLLIATHLQFGYDISEEHINFLKEQSLHNLAIVYNYGAMLKPETMQTIQNTFESALQEASNDESKLFSVKHYTNFLIDNGHLLDAEKLIKSVIEKAISEEAKNALQVQLSTALMAQIRVPYNQEKLQEILTLHQKSIAFYEANNLKINAGLLLTDAAEVANFQKNFILSKAFINKAILYFKEENIPEFLGEATYQKAILLYTWSKNGSPQYYKPAINTFQNALKVFKRDTNPQKFADIHHHLALIYSEIKVSENEKPIWTAFCASSFKEALAFYTQSDHPYQNAMIAHNYATALMGFPEAKLHNNMDKAFDLFEEALAVRTAEKYPFERALTLLNQLELYWLLHNENDEEETKKYESMLAKANEIHQLVSDTALCEKANQHLEALEKLKTIIE